VLLLALASFASFTSIASDAAAAPLKVRVRGAAKLTARASRDQTATGATELVLSGTLTDDAGQPLPLQKVTIRVVREAAPDDDGVAQALRTARGCDTAAGRGPTAWSVNPGGRNEVVTTTDEDGRFCFRARLEPPDRFKATLVYVPSGPQTFVDGAEREISFDLLRRGLALRFDPVPHVLHLDAQRTLVDAVAIVDDDATPRVAPGLNLVLSNEKEELARAVTDATGRARFTLPGEKLGPPGPGELRITFAGDGETAFAAHAEDIERHVKVVVKVPAAERGELSAAVPEDGIPLVVDVTEAITKPNDPRGPLNEGSVEARVGEVVVGAAPVERGAARLTLTFTAQGNEALVRLRYVPASPWYETQGEPTVRIPIRGPGLLPKVPILLAGLAVLALFLVGRVSGQKSKPEPIAPVDPAQAREGKPRVEVVRAAARGQEGWTGRIVDAHEGTPIPGARVWIERGTFEGHSVLASAETDGEGRFALPTVGAMAGDESIVAEARLHARLVQELPLPGEIAIALAERRRALLARMVKWARRRGAPFDVRPEPTPGHVRRAAAGGGARGGDDLAAARWAEAIEQAAFGPVDVDARIERDIEDLAPSGNETPEKAPSPNDLRPRRS
jgi:hypothetical protein